MARRADHSRDELLSLTQTAVADLVEAEGYRGLTMRRVAARIGYSVGTLYNLFADLDDMVLQVNAATLDELNDALAEIRLSGQPEVDLQALLDAYLGFTAARPGSWDMLFEHTLKEGAAVPDWYSAKVAGVMEHLAAALAPLFSEVRLDGDLTRANEAKRNAHILWASLHGIWSLAQAGKLSVVSPEPAAALARSLVENYITGLRIRLAGTDPSPGEPVQ